MSENEAETWNVEGNKGIPFPCYVGRRLISTVKGILVAYLGWGGVICGDGRFFARERANSFTIHTKILL